MFNTDRSLQFYLEVTAYWDTFAATNNIAEEFLQVATQAPQPIQVAASKADQHPFVG
jgi:hypothetical protein